MCAEDEGTDGKVSGEGFYHGEVKESSDGVDETVD